MDGETVDQYEASIDPTKVNIDVEVERSQSFVENRELLYLEKKRIKELLSKIEDLRQWGNTKLTELVNNNNNNEQNDTSMQIDEENSDEDGESGDQNISMF